MGISQESIVRLRADLEQSEYLCPNSSKPIKLESMASFAEHIHGRGGIDIDTTMARKLKYEEPLFEGPSAIPMRAARHKAETMKSHLTSEGMGAGTDGAFYLFDGDSDRWIQLHQLGRNGVELTQEELIREYRFLKQNLVKPSTLNGRAYVAWGHAIDFRNGINVGRGDMVLAKCAPMELGYFQTIFSDAVVDGSIYAINARVPLFEALAVADLIEALGFIPDHAWKRRESVSRFMCKSNEQLRRIGVLEAVTTTPWSILGFDIADHYSLRIHE